MAKKTDKQHRPKPSSNPSGGKNQAGISIAASASSADEEATIQGLAWSQIRIPPAARWTPHTSDETQLWSMVSLLEPGRVVIDGKALRTTVKPMADTNTKET